MIVEEVPLSDFFLSKKMSLSNESRTINKYSTQKIGQVQ